MPFDIFLQHQFKLRITNKQLVEPQGFTISLPNCLTRSGSIANTAAVHGLYSNCMFI